MAKEQADAVAISQAAAREGAEGKIKQVRIIKGDYHDFKFAGVPMRIRINPGEVFTVHEDKNRPKVRRVDRTVSPEFAADLVKSKQAEWHKA